MSEPARVLCGEHGLPLSAPGRRPGSWGSITCPNGCDLAWRDLLPEHDEQIQVNDAGEVFIVPRDPADNEGVTIETGVSGHDQEHSFMNATLDVHGTTAVSIATFVNLPEDVDPHDQRAVAEWLGTYLNEASDAYPRLRFSVQVGPDEEN